MVNILVGMPGPYRIYRLLEDGLNVGHISKFGLFVQFMGKFGGKSYLMNIQLNLQKALLQLRSWDTHQNIRLALYYEVTVVIKYLHPTCTPYGGSKIGETIQNLKK